MKIKDYITLNGITATTLTISTYFDYKSDYFNIYLSFYDNTMASYNHQEVIDSQIIKEWFDIAKIEPEKAGFLNFQIPVEWVCKKYGIIILD